MALGLFFGRSEAKDSKVARAMELAKELPSNINSISAEHINRVRNLYENGTISYGKLSSLLSHSGESPEKYGYFIEAD